MPHFAEEFREAAASCRHLAAACVSNDTKKMFFEMAREFECEAAQAPHLSARRSKRDRRRSGG